MPNRVKYYRKLRKMTQGDLAKRIDYTQPGVLKIEKMQVRPLRRTRELLAWALDVPVSELFPEDENNTVAA